MDVCVSFTHIYTQRVCIILLCVPQLLIGAEQQSPHLIVAVQHPANQVSVRSSQAPHQSSVARLSSANALANTQDTDHANAESADEFDESEDEGPFIQCNRANCLRTLCAFGIVIIIGPGASYLLKHMAT